jgi:hypothetical protein
MLMTTPTGKSGHGDKTSRKEEQAIASLLSQGTIGQAAIASNISESTLRRWLKEPHFQAAYSQAKRQILEGTVNRLRSIGDAAVDGLSEVVKDKNSPAGARVSAGRTILEVMFRAVEMQDLAERLDKLEEAMGKE